MSANNPLSNIPPLGPPTGMMPGGQSSKFKPVDPMRVLRANWLWIAIAAVFGGAIGAGLWYGLDNKFPKYTSEMRFDVEAKNQDSTTETQSSGGPVNMSILEPIINTEAQRLKSDPIMREAINTPAVQATEWFAQFDGNIEAALEDMEKNVLSAAHMRDTSLIAVLARTSEELDGQVILNELKDIYLRQKERELQSKENELMNAARGRLSTATEQITTIQGNLSRFLETNRIDTLDERTSEASIQVAQLVSLKGDLENSFSSLQAQYDQLLQREQEGNFEPSDEERQFIEQGQEIIQIDSTLRALRVERATAIDRFGEEHVMVKQLDNRILSMQRERDQEFEDQSIRLFKAKLQQTSQGQQILTQELQKITDSLAELNLRRQDYVRLRNRHDQFLRELEQAEMDRAEADRAVNNLIEMEQRRARVSVKLAQTPQPAKKTFPPEWYITIPMVGFLFTGGVTGLIFLRELTDQRVRSAADVKMLPDVSLLGMIPSADEDRSGARRIEHVVAEHPAGLLSESFRQVRTAVLSKMDRRGYKTLMLVSAKPGAGVTSIAENLGASCALSGRRVLIIDANFRRPRLAQLTGVARGPGVVEALTGVHPVDRVAELAQPTATPGLSVLPAGDAGRAAVELFETVMFRELLGRLESEFDILIIDAPPALLTSDAALLTKHVDATVLVSHAGNDTRGMLGRLHNEMDGQRADILGVLLNGVQASAGGYLRANFQEFHAYSEPDRRGSRRQAPTAPATNGQQAAANGSGHAGHQAHPTPVATQPQAGEDPFDGFDLTDDDAGTNK